MPIDTKHPVYTDYEEDWIDCRDAYKGQRAVKNAGTRYLPALTGQTSKEYDAYKARALFYSITHKTVSALLGMALDKPPEMTYPSQLKPYFEEKSGTKFFELLSHAISETLLMGRLGVLVDRPAGGGAPYPIIYQTEDIVNWEVDEDDKLTMVVLREVYEVRSSADKFKMERKTRYRHLYLDETGFLIIEVFEKNPTDFVAQTPTTITNTGRALDFIPFFCVTPNGLDIKPDKPPMLDIVQVNLSHYRTSADLEHGRHFTGLPTPYVTGAESQSKMHIGSTSAWIIPEPSATVGFLEFTGQGLQSLEKALAEKQSQLAALSARLIDNSTRGSEAAETVRLRYMSETSSLRSIVRAVEGLVNEVFNAITAMEGWGPVSVTLAKEFLNSKLSAAEIKAWTDAYLGGAIPKEVFIHNLKTGNALPPPGSPQGEFPDPPVEVKPPNQPQPATA